MEGRFGYVVLTARYFYVTALVHLTKDFDDLIYSVSFLFHDSGRVLARQSLIFNGPVYGGQVNLYWPTDQGYAPQPRLDLGLRPRHHDAGRQAAHAYCSG